MKAPLEQFERKDWHDWKESLDWHNLDCDCFELQKVQKSREVLDVHEVFYKPATALEVQSD